MPAIFVTALLLGALICSSAIDSTPSQVHLALGSRTDRAAGVTAGEEPTNSAG